MKRGSIATASIALIVAGIGSAYCMPSQSQEAAHYTHAQIRHLQRDAHTPEQYGVLASYFSEQQKSYLQKASEEKTEWDRRAQNTTSVNAKYPRPVDSARNLYEYYMYKASETGSLSSKYKNLVASTSQDKLQ